MGRRYQPEQAAALLAGDRVEQDRFFRFCHAIARRGTTRFGVRSQHDDIAQDLALSLLDGPVRAFATNDITSDTFVLTALNTARSIAQRYQRAEIRQRTMETHADDSDDDRFRMTPDALRDDVDPEKIMLEREIARSRLAAIADVRAKLAAKPTCVPVASRYSNSNGNGKIDGPPGEHGNSKTASGRLEPPSLHELLERIGWSRERAGEVIGNPDWYCDPELLFAPCTHSAYRRIVRSYGLAVPREPIAATLNRWAALLEFEPDDYRGLASRLGVDYTTFFRWRTGRTQSTPALRAKLSKYVYDAITQREVDR